MLRARANTKPVLKSCLTWMVQERNIMSWPRVPRLGMYSRMILCRTTTGLGPSGG